jgi:hypothetical protein
VYNRRKDRDSATGQWMAELMKENPWYKDVLPNVRIVKLRLFSELLRKAIS